jgi:hypothetical protein
LKIIAKKGDVLPIQHTKRMTFLYEKQGEKEWVKFSLFKIRREK